MFIKHLQTEEKIFLILNVHVSHVKQIQNKENEQARKILFISATALLKSIVVVSVVFTVHRSGAVLIILFIFLDFCLAFITETALIIILTFPLSSSGA